MTNASNPTDVVGGAAAVNRAEALAAAKKLQAEMVALGIRLIPILRFEHTHTHQLLCKILILGFNLV